LRALRVVRPFPCAKSCFHEGRRRGGSAGFGARASALSPQRDGVSCRRIAGPAL
jgi:hypothetical protein